MWSSGSGPKVRRAARSSTRPSQEAALSQDPEDVERYLHRHIPLSRAMEVQVVDADPDAVELSAPFPPNVNHRETAFGGSVSALAILAGWTWVHLRRDELPAELRIVIQRNLIEYREPVDGPFRARVLPPDSGAWDHVVTAANRWGKGRIVLRVAILHGDGRRAADFEGAYVAIGPEAAS